jgi:hypothetical protein
MQHHKQHVGKEEANIQKALHVSSVEHEQKEEQREKEEKDQLADGIRQSLLNSEEATRVQAEKIAFLASLGLELMVVTGDGSCAVRCVIQSKRASSGLTPMSKEEEAAHIAKLRDQLGDLFDAVGLNQKIHL